MGETEVGTVTQHGIHSLRISSEGRLVCFKEEFVFPPPRINGN